MGMTSRLYSFNESPKINTTVDVSFIIHDFEKSHNNQIISKEICEENMQTLINKPVVVKYNDTGDSSTDSFEDHAVRIGKNRDDGSDMIVTKTTPIGVFTGVEITTIENVEVLVGHAKLWSDRMYNSVSLLYQMLQEGINVKCSCEYLFCNYSMEDGVQYIQSPIEYDGHCVLNSDENRGVGIVEPAYDSSRVISFNSAIIADIANSINNKKENGTGEGDKVSDIKVEDVEIEEAEVVVEEVEETAETIEKPTVEVETSNNEVEEEVEAEKSLNEKSILDKQREKVESLKNQIVEKIGATADYVYLSAWSIYDDYFVYEVYDQDSCEYKNYKCSFGYNEVGELLLGDQVKEVTREEIWVEVNTYQTSLNEIESLKAEKITLAEEVVALNTKVAELTPYKEKVEEIEFDANLEVAKNTYEEKFTALNGVEKFETEEVQALIKDTLNAEKSLNAKAELADILLDMVKPVKKEVEAPVVKEVCSKKVEKLIPTVNKYEHCGLNL